MSNAVPPRRHGRAMADPRFRRAARWYAAGTSVVAIVGFATPSFASLTVRSVTRSVNLVQNGGFESGSTAGWRTNSTAEVLTLVTAAHSGTYAGRLTTTKLSDAVLNDKTNTVSSTTKGTAYSLSAWVRTTTPKTYGELRVREVLNGTQVGKQVAAFSLTDTSWHEVQLSFTTVSTGAALDLNVVGFNMAVGENLFVDDVSLIPAPAPTPTTTSPTPVPTTTSPTPAPTTSSPTPAPTTTSPTPAPTTTSPTPVPTTSSPAPTCTVNAILVPSCGSWLGVAPSPLNGESYDQALVNFESTIGRTVGIAHYYHRGTQLFPTSVEIGRARQAGHRRLLLENWRPENGYTWSQVAYGACDGEIDNEAAYLTSHFTERFFLAIHGEPEDEVVATAGSGYTAADFRAMFRHIVLRLRADGVKNAVTVMDYTGSPRWGSASWFGEMYPGNDVVDWLAEDPYMVGPVGGWYDNDYPHFVNRQFPGYSFSGFSNWAATVAPGKPIMIAEWGVDELSSDPSWKPSHFDDIAAELAKMPQVKALVYWNSNTFNPVGTTRVDSSPASLSAFRSLAHLAALNPDVPTS